VFNKLYARALVIADLDKYFRQRSTRQYLRKHHFPDVPSWSLAWSLPNDKTHDAYMASLHFMLCTFEELAAHVRPHFPAYNPVVVKPKSGRPLNWATMTSTQ
jgi:hypothetical protein